MSISGGGAWGGSEALGGPKGDSGSDNRKGRGHNTDYSKHPGYRGPSQSGGGGSSNNNQPQKSQFDTAAMRTARFELARREKAALNAYESSGMNMAKDAFNDDEEGINSISEALGRFGSWVQDRFGIDNPGGFAKSDVATGLATVGGFALGGPVGAGIANFAHSTYSERPGKSNMIGNAARAIGIGAPGVAGLIGTGVGLVDDYVTDLDEITDSGVGASMAKSHSSLGQTTGLYQGADRSGDNVAPPAKIKKSSSAGKSSGRSPTKTATTPSRRTLSPLNLRFAALRGVPTIEELL